jgi:DNA-binding response OmpR family regulator
VAAPPTALGNDHRKALAIGDDPGQRRILRAILRESGIALVEAARGRSGLKVFYAEHPDVIVLDSELEDVDGLAVLATIRELSDVPVIVTASTAGGETERVRALRSGADDCVSKPFSPPELLARIEALLRRPRSESQPAAILDDEYVHIDRVRHRVEVLGVEVALTPTEFRMLSTFAEHPGRVLGHAQLLEMVWGNGIRERDEVKLYVSYLRRKLEDAAQVNPIETVRGVGYRYRPRRSRKPLS